MKLLSTIRYIIFAFIVLGYFANFAQNEYGFSLITNGILLIALSWLANVVLMGKEMWRGRKVLIMMISTIFLICSGIGLIFLYANYHKEIDIRAAAFGGLGVFLLIPTLLVMLVITAMINQRKNLTYGKLSVVQFFALFVFFFGFYAKQNYFQGSNGMIIFSGGILLLIFLRRLLGILIRSENAPAKGSFVIVVFYVNVIFSLLGIVFRIISWKGADLFISLAIISSVASVLAWIFRPKFRAGYSDSIAVKRPAMTFVLIYFNYVVIIMGLISINILPRSYTLHAPVALKNLREESANPKTDPRIVRYEENFDRFKDRREMEKVDFETHITIN